MKIDKSTYQGYLWYSDEKEPRVFNNEEFELDIANDENPFVVEGHLFDGINSISIKYVDGKYIVKTYEVKDNDFKSPNLVKEFLPNCMKSVKKLRFLEYWKPKEDNLCENMEVLQPAEFVFVGFKK